MAAQSKLNLEDLAAAHDVDKSVHRGNVDHRLPLFARNLLKVHTLFAQPVDDEVTVGVDQHDMKLRHGKRLRDAAAHPVPVIMQRVTARWCRPVTAIRNNRFMDRVANHTRGCSDVRSKHGFTEYDARFSQPTNGFRHLVVRLVNAQ